MEPDWTVLTLFVVASLLIGGTIGGVAFSKTKVVESKIPVVTEKVVKTECPTIECPKVQCPEVNLPENSQIEDIWESEYSSLIDELKDNAKDVADEELERHDYEDVVDYVKDAVEGIDEDSIDVSVDDYDVKVVNLGVDEEEDKVAEVTYDLIVRYSFEEGPVQTYKKRLMATYEVIFEEGDYNDEDVELIQID